MGAIITTDLHSEWRKVFLIGVGRGRGSFILWLEFLKAVITFCVIVLREGEEIVIY